MQSLIFYSIVILFCVVMTGIFYILMALELKRKDKPVNIFKVSFNPIERIRIVKDVLKGYTQLKNDENKKPYLLWITLVFFSVAVLLILLLLITLLIS